MALTPGPSAALRAQARKVAIAEMWRRGDLYYLLHATQRRIYDKMKTGVAEGKLRHFLSCSRRLGKSYMLVAMALETALNKPHARILYLAPFANDARKIVQDTLETILPDCPMELRPSFKTQDAQFDFKNGATIRFRGTNGERAQFLRGGSADLVIVDECGIVDHLDEVVNQVITPMTLTTGGLVIMATTPSSTPAHDSKRLCDQAFADGCGYEFTLLDAPHLDHAAKARALKSAGERDEDIPAILAGKAQPKTTTALREYFAKWITDAGSAIVPEFTAEAKARIVQDYSRPPYYDAYVSMDPGYKDNTGILFGFWDIRGGKLVIEDEWLKNHAGTPEIAEAIAKKEYALWSGRKPHLRVSDIELRLISDLITEHGLGFSPALKSDREGRILLARQMVANGRLVIKPNCVNLIRQLETGTWNKRGSDFADEVLEIEGEKQIPAHFDLLAALFQLVRMVSYNRNPYPQWWDEPSFGSSVPRQKKIFKTIRTDTPLSRRLDKAGR